MFSDPDLNWQYDADLGEEVASYGPAEVLVTKARRCMRLDAEYREAREKGNLAEFRAVREARRNQYLRLKRFLLDTSGRAIVITDEEVLSFLSRVQQGQWAPEPLEDDEYEPDALGWFIGLAGDAAPAGSPA
jgi:hypothetical protein